MNIPTSRRPTHPGEMLKEEFLVPLEISHAELASGIRVPYQRVNELVNGKRGITPSTALRHATTPFFWINLQQRWDLYHAGKQKAAERRRIRTAT